MAMEFATVEVQGKQLHCNVCGNATFWQHEVQLPTPLFTFADAGEWNGVAQCAICERCGFMHWFVPPSALRDEEPVEGAKEQAQRA